MARGGPALGVIAVVSLSLGFVLGRLTTGGTPDRVTTRERELRERVDALAGRLRTARQEAERWKSAGARSERPRTSVGVAPVGSASRDADTQPRDADAIRRELAAAFESGDGTAVLTLLSELAALDEDNVREVVDDWIGLVNLDTAGLDALGLSELALSTALAAEDGLIRFALDETELDPVFRQFTARTLEQASVALRRAVLDTFDFSKEKDKKVLQSLVRAVEDFKDPLYVDRFLHLVRRMDLYNDSRSRIAIRIAEIGGPESRRALDVLSADGSYDRILPVLEHIYDPPATGLLITNAARPDDDRIGMSDILLEYNHRPIMTGADLILADSVTSPGDVVPVKLLRNGIEQTIHVTVTDTAPGHLHFDARAIRKKE